MSDVTDRDRLTRPDGLDRRIVPPGVADARGRAFIAILANAFDASDPSRLRLTDFDTVDAQLLPFLVRALSCEEFVTPQMPERIVRNILKSAIPLHIGKGRDQGVINGLRALEMDATIVQWFAETPMAAPNTHRIDVFASKGWTAGQAVTDPVLQNAALRMIRGTKRHSQQSFVRFIVGSRGRVRLGAYAHMRSSFSTLPLAQGDVVSPGVLRIGVAAGLTERHVTRPRLLN